MTDIIRSDIYLCCTLLSVHKETNVYEKLLKEADHQMLNHVFFIFIALLICIG